LPANRKRRVQEPGEKGGKDKTEKKRKGSPASPKGKRQARIYKEEIRKMLSKKGRKQRGRDSKGRATETKIQLTMENGGLEGKISGKRNKSRKEHSKKR